MFSIGLTALIRAVDTYGLDRGIIFFTYASRCVENKILMFLQRNKKHANNISLDETISSGEGDKKILDTLKDKNSNFMKKYEKDEFNRVLRQIIDDLPPIEK